MKHRGAFPLTVQLTRGAFDGLAVSITDVSDYVARVATATEQVTTVAQQAGSATGHGSAAAEQSSASTQQVAASAQELARSAEELERFVVWRAAAAAIVAAWMSTVSVTSGA